MKKPVQNKSRKQFYIKYLILFALGGFSLYVGIYSFCLFLIFLVWLFPTKGGESFNQRVVNFKKFKFRSILSGILILFTLISLSQTLFENYKDSTHEKFLKTILEPEINILSSLEHQKDSLKYELRFEVANASNVTLNAKKIESNKDGSYSKIISLNRFKSEIQITAKNEYKKTHKTIVIERNETKEEHSMRIDKEKEQQKIKEESDRKAKFIRESQDGDIAVVCSQQKVKSLLKSPSSADFPMNIGRSSTPLGENKYLVKSYVDSQNSFGATMRTIFFCTTEVLNRESFRCKEECLFE